MKFSKREILEKFPKTIKHYKTKGAASILITERRIVLFDEGGSTLESLGLSELERIEASLVNTNSVEVNPTKDRLN